MAMSYGFRSQFSHSGNKLPVPHSEHLPSAFPTNTMITIMGEINRFADRFHINLMSPRNETLLHINPRFQQGKVVRNSHLQGSWGPEENDGGLPLHRGHPFGCIILAGPDKFMIAFNGQHFTEYQFRAPNTVNKVQIDGDINLHTVDVSMNPTLPMPPPMSAPTLEPAQGFPNQGFPPVQDESVVYTPPVPFKAKLAGGMYHGRSLTLSCIPKHNPQRIRIDLQKDMDGTEIALHIDLRFHVGEHRRIICMNDFKHGHWGEEARYHQFPFQGGVGFDFTIRSEASGYVIYANGVQIAFFEHRERDVARVNQLHVQGDLKITRVSF